MLEILLELTLNQSDGSDSHTGQGFLVIFFFFFFTLRGEGGRKPDLKSHNCKKYLVASKTFVLEACRFEEHICLICDICGLNLEEGHIGLNCLCLVCAPVRTTDHL